ncbi:hypothetical protein DFA_02954 [Cavenderia fasciculata]|uniref:IPT/TIG domain-containing protein n=1 Tax=Cavenderia fasciculata TaxID=261658 RepID=F4PG76_CACFS|nr:uncharacterized protein DFA_02954 [Cavenderia fasciculata]EGG24710.1 hypothetical protein DFA_02954 [Cavenderia fasciculata]|eukprot:XP_004362561.1 hypothetical protein DFA_02954 [Cavenderia fasciculata]
MNKSLLFISSIVLFCQFFTSCNAQTGTVNSVQLIGNVLTFTGSFNYNGLAPYVALNSTEQSNGIVCPIIRYTDLIVECYIPTANYQLGSINILFRIGGPVEYKTVFNIPTSTPYRINNYTVTDDTIQLNGFYGQINPSIITINGTACNITMYHSSIITCRSTIFPFLPNGENYPISIKGLYYSYELITDIIADLDPLNIKLNSVNVSSSQQVVLNGMFGNYSKSITVNIGGTDKVCSIKSNTTKTIVCTLPSSIPTGTYVLSFTSASYTSVIDVYFPTYDPAANTSSSSDPTTTGNTTGSASSTSTFTSFILIFILLSFSALL